MYLSTYRHLLTSCLRCVQRVLSRKLHGEEFLHTDTRFSPARSFTTPKPTSCWHPLHSFYIDILGLKPSGKLGAPGSSKSSNERSTGGKSDGKGGITAEDRAATTMGMDPLGIAGVPMTLGSQQGPLGGPLGDLDPAAAGAGAEEGEGERAGTSQV